MLNLTNKAGNRAQIKKTKQKAFSNRVVSCHVGHTGTGRLLRRQQHPNFPRT
jgi:hypothetical protein